MFSLSNFPKTHSRYEIAADEIRVELAYNVAKRYLGLCADGHATEDTGGGGRGDDGDDGKCDDDSGIGGDTKKLSNHDDPAAEKKSLAGSNSLTNSNAVVAGKGTANNANNSSSNNAIKKCSGDDEDDDNDEFVLDILNDDIVAQVRSKLLSRLNGNLGERARCTVGKNGPKIATCGSRWFKRYHVQYWTTHFSIQNSQLW